ncbi:MAG TPA: hypothetical protein VGG57_13895 [Stellaceae bacterium]|jgi:hypothetical protein
MTLTKRIAGAAAFGTVLLFGLQMAYADPVPGKECHAMTSSGDKVNDGTYNDKNECCGPAKNFCINCDNSSNTCGDGHKQQ